MFDDLSQVKRRYEELAYRMTTPEAMNDPAAYAAMMREYKELTPLVEAYRSYTALQKEVEPRAEDFYLTDEFLAYKREIIAKL